MSGFPHQGPEGVLYAPEYEEVPSRAGFGGWLFVVAYMAVGTVSGALAFSEEFAAGKAVFAGDGWRIFLGSFGVVLAFLGCRAIVRNLTDHRPKLTPELHRRASRRGRVLIVVGAALAAMASVEAAAESSIEFRSWAKPFYVWSGAGLILTGLALQWNPTQGIRARRVARGEGRPGSVRILQASDTGTSSGDSSEVRIDFELSVSGHTYQVRDDVMMERAKLALLVPGATMDVLVDRVDPTIFKIDWDSWKGPAPGA